LHHIKELSLMIRPGATILDLACGPGPLLLELAELYPECHFIGADLSPLMLEFLQTEARARGLSNVTVLLEDIRVLPSLATRKVDLVISTSALHHLPSEDDLKQVFSRLKSLLKEDGGFYIFDFALLKSDSSRRLLVQELSKLAPPLTTHDYDMSLRAAFPLRKVLDLAHELMPRPYVGLASLFVDFFYFLQTPKTLAVRPVAAQAKIDRIWRDLSVAMKVEYLMLRAMRRVVAR
jgi:arsenite methyltransferase